MRRAAFSPVAIAGLLFCLGLPASGMAERSRPLPEIRIETRLLGGLDQGLGAASLGLGAGFRDAVLLPSLGLSIVGDPLLSCWLAEATLGLGLGPGFEFYFSISEPLGSVTLEAGGGRRLSLARTALPSGIGAQARLATVKIRTEARLDILADASWTAWTLESAESGNGVVGYASEDALRIFGAGFSFGLTARLSVATRKEAPPGP
ncbi:MAG TPA: hypothetical protein VMV44_05005 [Rectinemataceae bacterium]|nr:hypothetical protein [Rectinemataceae bacterium]